MNKVKEYNIKLLVDDDKVNFLFDCDKEKNRKCNKKNCNQYCNHTTDSRYIKAKARQNNNSITDQEIIINLEKEIEYYRNKIEQILVDKIMIDKQTDNTIGYDITNVYADDKLIQVVIDYKYK